jgi:hypothetical protein
VVLKVRTLLLPLCCRGTAFKDVVALVRLAWLQMALRV